MTSRLCSITTTELPGLDQFVQHIGCFEARSVRHAGTAVGSSKMKRVGPVALVTIPWRA